MRKLTAVFLAVFLVLGISLSGAWAADKLGYLDLTRAFNEYNKAKDYDKAMKEKSKGVVNELQKMAGDVKQLEDKINLLSDKEKSAQRPGLEKKYKDFEDFRQQKEAELSKEEGEKRDEILKDIKDVVDQYCAKEGYSLVFNSRFLIYQSKALEITDKIVEALNKSYKK